MYAEGELEECTDNFVSKEADNLKNPFKYESLYYVSVKGVKNNPISNQNNLGEYLKTVNPTDSNSCLLIGEFKDINLQTNKEEYYYSYVAIEENEG